MSSTATPTGAEPVGTLSASGSFSGKFRHFKIASAYAADIFYGDFVEVKSGGTVEKKQVTSSLGTKTVGIFLGCQYTDPNSNQLVQSQYWPTGTVASDAVAFVNDDPFLLFKMQGDGSTAASSLFLNIPGINTAGDTTIGRSKNALDAGSAATTNTLPFRIIEFVQAGDSVAGDSFTDMIVTYLPTKHAHLTILGI